MQRILLIAAFAGLPFSGFVRAADEPAEEIRPQEAWSDYFGNQTVRMHWALRTSKAFSGRLGLSLVAEGGRVLWRGEAAVRTKAGRLATVQVAVPLPPVKPAVILPLVLEATAFEPTGTEPVASFRKQLWIFPQDPFAGRQVWLEGLEIALYDPQGATADVLEASGVPFQRIHNPAALADRTSGLILVGEGASWRRNRSLPEMLAGAAARGLPVLSLAPTAGQGVLPGTGEDAGPPPAAVLLRRCDVINELDKRLDAETWPPDGRAVASSLVLRGRGSSVAAEVATDGRGWPWLEIRYPQSADSQGRLLVCGFAIIEKWDAGPSPRFLLARLLEYLTTPPGKTVGSAEPEQ